MFDFCFASLEYNSSFVWHVSKWFDENLIIIEKFLDLIQILIVEKKKNI
jgi:hypothetical protein